MDKRRNRKLKLHRETLQWVGDPNLRAVAGGYSGGACTVLTTCSPDCCPPDTGADA